MKKIIFAFLFALIGTPVFADPILTRNALLSSTTAGDAYDLRGTGVRLHTLVFYNPGPITTCTLKLEQSANGVTAWSDLIAAVSCTANGTVSFTSGVANFVRPKLATYGGSGTLSVFYAGYLDNTVAALDAATTIIGGNQLTTGTSDAQSAYTQINAGITKNCPAGMMVLVGGVLNNDAAAGYAVIQVAIGGSGSETNVIQTRIGIAASGSGSFTIIVPRAIAAGTRVSIRGSWSGATGATLHFGFSIGQVS